MEKKILFLQKLQPTMSKKPTRIFFVLILLTSVITAAHLRFYSSLQTALALSIMSLIFPWCSLPPPELTDSFFLVSQI